MSTQRVLIVDDRPTNQTIFAKLASALDVSVEVRTSGDPRDALTLLDDWRPDLIIVDYSMPEMNGAEFTREVRRLPSTSDVPIIVITAYDDRQFRLSALEAGATDFLQSPVDRREFQSRVHALLAFRRQQLSINDRAAAFEAEPGRELVVPALLGSEGHVLAQVLDSVPIMISAVDREGLCLFANAQLAARCGMTPAQLVGTDLSTTLGENATEPTAERNRIVLETARPLPAYEETIEQDSVRHIYVTHKSPLRDVEGAVVGVLTSSVDITGRKRAETHLNHMARHDVLTGLPNRIMLRDRLQAALTETVRTGGLAAVFLLDLDRFKSINDTRGHRAGDQLLEKVAVRIGALMGEGDCAARLGGDEFAVLQAGLVNRDQIRRRAEMLLAAIDSTYRVEDQNVAVTASLGISVAPMDGASPDELLRTADLAMYEAKGEGGNGFRFYEAEMNHKAQVTATLEADLHGAIDRDEFMLYYQPLVSARTGMITSVEALLRWQHPTRGMLGPSSFLGSVDETGMILPVGAWVLRAACRQLVEWRRRGVDVPRVSVNLSAIQFQREDVFAMTTRILDETGLEPGALELEIVESVLVANRAAVAETLRKLRDYGVRISVDDFGTGYSSLQYLRDLPVDRLKIDRSFVVGLPQSTKDAAIVHAITSMGHDLGLDIAAEGVETDEQRVMLRAIGCDHLQGYLIARPCAPSTLEALFRGAAMPTARAGLR